LNNDDRDKLLGEIAGDLRVLRETSELRLKALEEVTFGPTGTQTRLQTVENSRGGNRAAWGVVLQAVLLVLTAALAAAAWLKR